MNVGALQPLNLTFRRADMSEFGTGRAPGIHLSEIVREMKIAAGEKVTGIDGEDPHTRPQVGFWWERALQLAMREHLNEEEFGQIEWQLHLLRDRIHMTPDGVWREHNLLISVKFTWRTMRAWEEAAEQEFWAWMVAEMGYALALGVSTCRFYIFWAGGDYTRKPGRGAQPTYCDVEFSDQDLDDNWSNVLRYRDWMEERDGTQTPEP